MATPVGGSPVKVSATGGLVRASADTVPYDLVLKAVAKQLKEASIGLEFLTGEVQGSHDPSGVVFSVLAALSGSTVISLDRIEVYGGVTKAATGREKWQKWPAEWREQGLEPYPRAVIIQESCIRRPGGRAAGRLLQVELQPGRRMTPVVRPGSGSRAGSVTAAACGDRTDTPRDRCHPAFEGVR